MKHGESPRINAFTVLENGFDGMQSLENVAEIRAAVAFLGEKSAYDWWSSSFLSSSGAPFISPTFNSHTDLARLIGAIEAARRSHDAAIGVGRVFHLFRLPEMVEQDLHECLLGAAPKIPQATSQALEVLTRIAGSATESARGPMCLGPISMINDINSAARMAALYKVAFESGMPVFPYFSEST